MGETNINIDFSQERSQKKSFEEIASMLSSLQTDIQKEQLHSEMSAQIMNNLHNKNIGVTIISKDTLFGLNRLLPDGVEISFSKKSGDINIGDTIFLDDGELIVISQSGIRHSVGTLIGVYDGDYFVNGKKNSLFIRKYIESIDTDRNKEIVRGDSSNIYKVTSGKDINVSGIEEIFNEEKNLNKGFDIIIMSQYKYYRVFVKVNEGRLEIIDPNYIFKKSTASINLEDWKSFYGEESNFKIVKTYGLYKQETRESASEKDTKKEKDKAKESKKEKIVKKKVEKETKKGEQKIEKISLNNPEIKKIFSKFYEKHTLDFISKEDILNLSKGNYYVATAMIMVHKLEQGNTGLIDLRRQLKDALSSQYAENIISYYKPIFDILDFSGIKSRGEFQIRYTKKSLGKSDLNTFFGQYNNGDYNDLSMLSSKDKQILNTLGKKHKLNNDLNTTERKQLLDNRSLNTIMASIYLRKRFNKTLKYYPSLNNKDTDNHFILLSTMLEAYHKGPSWGLKAQTLINSTLKLGEKFGIYDKDSSESFQVKVREDTKVINVGDYEIHNESFGRVQFYKRGKKLFTEALSRIKKELVRDKATVIAKLYVLGEEKPEEAYNKIIKHLNLPLDVSKFSMYMLKPELSQAIKKLSSIYDVNFLDFTLEDYMNSDTSKALLIGNYGPSAWYLLNK